MIAPARIAAYEVGLAVAAGRADLPAAIALARGGLRDERDRALAAEVATGVQRWRAALDFLVRHYSRRDPNRLDPEVIEILRLSAYQLLHLTRVPASAVVDDAVSLTRRAGKASASGFVNAVLRAISRNRGSLPFPPRPADERDRGAAIEYFSITLSHSRWLAARWYDRLGFERTEARIRFNNSPAPLTLRANRLRTSRGELKDRLADAGVDASPARYAPDALVVVTGNPLRAVTKGTLDSGLFVVQDEASQLVALLAGERPGPLLLDTCASPGGKTTWFSSVVTPAGRVIACDVRDRRMALLRRAVVDMGAANVRLVQADLLEPLPFLTQFDCVVVDAPCSGLGTLRRDPDLRWKRREEDLPALAAAQRRLLANAASVVAPGGRLVYATCSSEPEENEAIAGAFLDSDSRFTAEDARGAHPAIDGTLVDGRGHLRTSPEDHGLEAFFGAVFRRRSP